jgi:DNA-binding NarL/FixJ family response regulator
VAGNVQERGGWERPVTCLVADDHPAIVEAVAHVLEASGVEVVARLSDGERALAEIRRQRPAVAVMDVRMPRLSGIEVARRVHAYAGVVLYSGYAEPALVLEALDAGARGYVLKESPLSDLVRAVQAVAGGGSWVDPLLAGRLAVGAGEPGRTLTAREREVLRLLADGYANDEVAELLHLSPETVRTHLRKAMRKLGAETRTEAVATALRRRLIV